VSPDPRRSRRNHEQETCLLNTPLRVTVDTSLLHHLHTVYGPFQDIIEYIDLVEAEEHGVRPYPYDNDVLEQIQAYHMSYNGKWLLHLEKQRLASRSSKAAITFSTVEIGIWHYEDDLYGSDSDCWSVLTRFAHGVIGGNTSQTKLMFTHRLISGHVPAGVLAILKRLGHHYPSHRSWLLLEFHTGDHIDSVEYENEWRASDGFESSANMVEKT
jgi:hypothetical protein